ncbi:beta-galactosidase [Alicyclobacillus vulcanalis]|uniref:Beta-galactosidase n=2 Tax=Alicyclobacillus vulcanalis TaxID=252246 RepID=A0A1N7LLY6_9BACL|nr:beta-galactosidase [Alicyclobacillus vulcanalis]
MSMAKQPPIFPNVQGFLHGGDYNPDQWLAYPDVLERDMELMREAKWNVVSLGIFSWVSLEPEEGVFTFDWLDEAVERLTNAGVRILLATPSGARPAWMSAKYPEVLRVAPDGRRNLHGGRHNHCYTSPVYREKVRIINQKLAERYAHHPGVIGWHVSNEYGGECHCPLCQQAFREWLKRKYQTLDALNHAWWTPFWSHTYTDWSQIESPMPHGEMSIHGLNLDWKRFVTHQTVDFCRHEMAPLKEVNPKLPVTTNFMGTYPGLNYWRFRDVLDIISWDSYPRWHTHETLEPEAVHTAMVHDLNRSILKKPFLLMESTPSVTNWQAVSKQKRPGVHTLVSLQAVAHGADSVQYFQWRKSRGSCEKFHGAVVDHVGHANTRVFRDVQAVGEMLERLAPVAGAEVQADAAVIFDWENRWALEDAKGPRNVGLHYEETVVRHYAALWRMGVPMDVIDEEQPLDGYKLVVAPMLYMVRPGVAERMKAFVEAGGTLVLTYWSGIVDENDLVFLGGFPGPLRELAGVWAEEIDALYDGERVPVSAAQGNPLGLAGRYEARELCEVIHLEGAEPIALYDGEYYAGMPAATVHRVGNGTVYYVAARLDQGFMNEFFSRVADQVQLRRALDAELPDGVSAMVRSGDGVEYVFLMNFTPAPREVKLDGKTYTPLFGEAPNAGMVRLSGYGVSVLERPAL